MDTAQWLIYLQLLENSQTSTVSMACVGCWYEQHPREAFPGNLVSSSLCTMHVSSLPPEVKRPDSLWEAAA